MQADIFNRDKIMLELITLIFTRNKTVSDSDCCPANGGMSSETGVLAMLVSNGENYD